MNRQVSKCVEEILKTGAHPLTLERLLQEIHDLGYRSITKSQVSDYLQFASSNGRVEKVQIPGRAGSGWELTVNYKRELKILPPLPVEPAAAHPAATVMDKLYVWQRKALSRWEGAGHRGIIEAVTGSGKTMAALAAWEHLDAKHKALRTPLHTLVVVPTIELMNQWCDHFERAFPGRRIGRIYGGSRDDFSVSRICVAVINSAVRRLHEILNFPAKTFLIADECHRYIDPLVFQKIRQYPFTFTLGLSATIDPYQVNGLGRVIFTYKFSDAVREGLVPAFDLVNVAVELESWESRKYNDLSKIIREERELIIEAYRPQLNGLDPSQKEFFRRLQTLMKREDGANDPVIARLFGLYHRRAAISYTAERKMALASQLAQVLLNEGRKKSIGFFERIRSAEDLADEMEPVDSLEVQTAKNLQRSVLASGSNWCRVLHSGLHRDDRHRMLADFKASGVAALLACRVLDEGVDVPEIDAALLVASTQSKRQRIQRIGRALRRGDGHKRPLIITLYIPETGDGNVTAEDTEIFGSAATIQRVTEKTCLEKIQQLLSK